MFPELIKERDSLGTPTMPQSGSVNLSTGLIDCSVFQRAEFLMGVGALTGNTITPILKECNSLDMSDATSVNGGTLTPITAGNVVKTIETIAGSPQNTKRYLFMVLSVNGTGAFTSFAIGRGTDCRFKPATSYDSGSIGERLAIPVS